MATITNTELGATGRYIDLGSSTAQTDQSEGTVIAYVRPTSLAVSSYLIAKGNAGGEGLRFFVGTTGSFSLSPYASTGVALAPSAQSQTGIISVNNWYHLQATYSGGLTAASIKLYKDALGELSPSATTNGSGSIVSDASYATFLMNRTGLGRQFVGSVAYIARWNRVLDSTERATVRADGPLAVPSGLILCWANEQDYSASAESVSSRSTFVAGTAPPNTALGDLGTIAYPAGVAVTSAVGTPTAIADVPATAYPAGVAAVSAVGTPVASGGASITLSGAYERSSVNLTGSGVAGDGDAAIVTINPKLQNSEVTSDVDYWQEPSVDVDGVMGIRPTFRLLGYKDGSGGIWFTSTGGWPSTRRAMFSYDDGVTWNRFDTAARDSVNDWIDIRHNTVFTGNKIRFGRGRQVSVHRTGDWLAEMAALHSFFVPTAAAAAWTPTANVSDFSAQAFIAEEFTAQVDSLGATVPIQPLYAAVINDTSLTRSGGGAKRVAMLTSGVHASEDTGNVVMLRAAEYLCSSAADAIALRREYKIFIYPMINAPGRAGGGWRGSWTNGTGGADDANRHFTETGSGLEIVDKPKAAMNTDRGAQMFDWVLDYHVTYEASLGLYIAPADAAHASFSEKLATHSGVAENNLGSASTVSLPAHWIALGAELGITVEVGEPTPLSDATLETYGTATIKAVKDMMSGGEFFALSATAEPTGVQALGAVGNLTATGAAWVVSSGVSATGSVGTPVALAGSTAVALPTGVQTLGYTGTPTAIGASVAYPLGVGGYWSVGTPIALVPGTAVYPTEAQVQLGVTYGPTGADYVGTLTGGSGPSAVDIAAAVWSYTQ